jgi:nitrile hydratase subunit beta
MDGIHDLGGKEGFGAVEPEVDEPVFHARWEARVFGMTLTGAGGAARNVDHFRHAIERIEPVAYLTHGYYGRWLGGLEIRIVEAGVLDTDAITQRAFELGASPNDLIAARPAVRPDRVDYRPAGEGNSRAVVRKARFEPGARVRTRVHSVPGHTRLPAYARGRVGVVTACHGGWVYPDANAHGRGETPQHLYTVAFDGSELWGDAAEPNVVVHLDLFEPYLERTDG